MAKGDVQESGVIGVYSSRVLKPSSDVVAEGTVRAAWSWEHLHSARTLLSDTQRYIHAIGVEDIHACKPQAPLGKQRNSCATEHILTG